MFRIRTALLLSIAVVAFFVALAHANPAAVADTEVALYEVAP